MSMSDARAVARGEDNYRIEVADFGAIRHAAVDLRPLTVLAGPSSTGKSYLAMLVYSLHQLYLRSSDSQPWPPSEGWYWLAVEMAESLLGIDDFPTRFLDWWSAVNESDQAVLSEDLTKDIRDAFWQVTAGRLQHEVHRCFGVDHLDDLVRLGSPETSSAISLDIPNRAGNEQHRYRIRLGSEGLAVSGRIGELPRFPTAGIVGKFQSGSADIQEVPLLLRLVLDGLAETLTGPLNRRAYYLPAGRGNVMENFQWLVSSLVRSATALQPRLRPNGPLLIGVLSDLVSGLIGMSQLKPGRLHQLADLLEKNLLAGATRLLRPGAQDPSFVYRPNKWSTDLPLKLASSMVSELAPVVLFLRYLVEPGDLLIIEEPESHLHPALQTTFARELARLVQSGVRVLITTHSEWILEAIANLVRLSELAEERREGIPGADVALASDHVGAWLFKPDPDGGGSEVAEIPLDTDVGSFPAGFGEVTEALYNEWARIGNRIEAAKADKSD
jgi:hypothetical protein